MKIESIQATVLQWPAPSRDFWVSLMPIGAVTELLVRVRTDDGVVGIGEGHGPGMVVSTSAGKRAAGAALAVRDLMAPLLKGKDPLDNERRWEEMFALTYRKGWRQGGYSREQIMTATAAVDMALWDIRGKYAKLPVYKLMGGYRNQVPAYVTGGYYRDGKTVQELQEECRAFVSWGFKGIKIKIAGVSVEEDVKRVEAVRKAIGPNVDLMLDANEGYDVPTAIRAGRAYEQFGIRWYEEPVHWYDCVEGLKKVSDSVRIPIASGETNPLTRWAARDLALRGGITLMQFDSTKTAGPTEWLRIAGMCAALNIRMAPHHDPQIHGHLVAAVPNGEIVETFPEAERDPIWSELFTKKPLLKDSILTLSDDPGWGVEVDEAVIKKRTVSF